jgi:holliday junction DNA helicase RuvA
MIAFVRGTVADVSLDSVVVEVAGVGLQLHCTPGTIATLKIGTPTRLPTSMVVREDSLTLFGFLDDDEKSMFELVQTASGVGPKLAQAMLAVLRPDELRAAVAAEDVTSLTRVPGVGRKGAQRIILELKDRIGAAGVPATGRPTRPVPGPDDWRTQVHAGLVGLGWSTREADQAVETVAPDADPATPDVPALLRAALRSLSTS